MKLQGPGKRNRIEHDHQCAFFDWLRLNAPKFPELGLFFAIPNGARRDYGTAVQLFLEGVKRGVLDTHLPLPRGGKAGLWIEFKAPGGRLSDDQRDWSEALVREGHAVYVVHDWIEAAEITANYLNLLGIQIPDRRNDDNKARSYRG